MGRHCSSGLIRCLRRPPVWRLLRIQVRLRILPESVLSLVSLRCTSVKLPFVSIHFSNHPSQDPSHQRDCMNISPAIASYTTTWRLVKIVQGVHSFAPLNPSSKMFKRPVRIFGVPRKWTSLHHRIKHRKAALSNVAKTVKTPSLRVCLFFSYTCTYDYASLQRIGRVRCPEQIEQPKAMSDLIFVIGHDVISAYGLTLYRNTP